MEYISSINILLALVARFKLKSLFQSG